MESNTKKLGKVSITVEKDYYNSEKEYNKLVVVENQETNTTYISRKPVHVGVDIKDREYWIPIGGSSSNASSSAKISGVLNLKDANAITEAQNALKEAGQYSTYIITDSNGNYPSITEKFVYLDDMEQLQNLLYKGNDKALSTLLDNKEAYYNIDGNWFSKNITDYVTVPSFNLQSVKVGDLITIIRQEFTSDEFYSKYINFDNISIDDTAFQLYKVSRGYGSNTDGEFIKFLIRNGEIYSSPSNPQTTESETYPLAIDEKVVFYTAQITPNTATVYCGEFWTGNIEAPGIYCYITLGRPEGITDNFIGFVSPDGTKMLLSMKNPYNSYVLENGKWKKIEVSGGVGKNTGGTGEIFNDYSGNIAHSDHAHAEGQGCKAKSYNAHAEGFQTTAGHNAHSENYMTTASGQNSHAEGDRTVASGLASHAEGGSYSDGENTLPLIASGNYSHAEGLGCTASGDGSHAEGADCTASGDGSHAEGSSNTANGICSHAEGADCTASGDCSHAEGSSNTANGICSHAEGADCTASGDGSHAEGTETQSIGNYSHAEGNITIANGIASHAEGGQTVADGDNSHAEGDHTKANRGNSHAEGRYTTASGENSHAEGDQTVASGNGSHSEGYNTKAEGIYSHAEGTDNIAKGILSHAEGSNTKANANISHAEGSNSITNGECSHAEGRATNANEQASHAEGYCTIASGVASHAEGYYTETVDEACHSEGMYTCTQSTYPAIHIVGIGTSDTNRKNAHVILKSGAHYIYGIGGYVGNNIESSHSLQEVIPHIINFDTSAASIDWNSKNNDGSITITSEQITAIFGMSFENIISNILNGFVTGFREGSMFFYIMYCNEQEGFRIKYEDNIRDTLHDISILKKETELRLYYQQH